MYETHLHMLLSAMPTNRPCIEHIRHGPVQITMLIHQWQSGSRSNKVQCKERSKLQLQPHLHICRSVFTDILLNILQHIQCESLEYCSRFHKTVELHATCIQQFLLEQACLVRSCVCVYRYGSINLHSFPSPIL